MWIWFNENWWYHAMILFYDIDVIWDYFTIFIWWYCFKETYGTMIFIWLRWCHEVAYWFDYDDATRWLMDMVYIYSYIWWWDDMRSWFYGEGYVELRAPMDEPMWKPHMERLWFIPSRLFWEMLAREEWLGCRHDASPHGRHTWVNTSVGLRICYFLVWWYKNLYVLCFQIYMYYKRNTGGF